MSQKRYFDKRAKRVEFEIDDTVWLLNTHPQRDVPFKLNPIDGRRLSLAIYEVTHVGENRTQVISVDRLAVYVTDLWS